MGVLLKTQASLLRVVDSKLIACGKNEKYHTIQPINVLCIPFGCVSVKFSYKHGKLSISNPKQIYFMYVKLEKCQINEICLTKQVEGLQIYLHIAYFLLQNKHYTLCL